MGYNYYLGIFGFMHEFWEIPTANMTYSKSEKNSNMVVDEHGIQAFTVVVAVLLLLLLFGVWCFCPHKYTSLINFEQVVCPIFNLNFSCTCSPSPL